MDPKHRDRIAFVRLVLGPLHARHEADRCRAPARRSSVHNAMLFQANERELAEEAWAGDIIGIPNHGTLRIGDALTEGEALHFTGIPSFAPEFLRRVRADDPMKAKHLGRALEQIAEEGAAQVFKLFLGSDFDRRRRRRAAVRRARRPHPHRVRPAVPLRGDVVRGRALGRRRRSRS